MSDLHLSAQLCPVPASVGAILLLFGPMRAERPGGHSFLPANRRTRAVLAVLALAEARPVAREFLHELLWGTRGREQAQASLRQCVHELRSCLAEVEGANLISDRLSLALRIDNLWMDAAFVSTPGLPAAQLAGVFRGPLLSDLAGLSENFDAWRQDQRNALARRLRPHLDSCLAETQDLRATVQLAEALLTYDPHYEAAWIALARCHLRLGDNKAARDVYQRCLAQNDGHGDDLSVDTAKLLAQFAQLEMPMGQAALTERPAGKAWPSQHAPAGRRQYAALDSTTCLAVAPTRMMGNVPPDLGICMDWQILSALSRFDEFVSAPVEFGQGWLKTIPHLVDEGFDFLLEGCVAREAAGAVQGVFRLRNLHMKAVVFWSQRISQPLTGALLSDAACVTELAPRIAAEVNKHQAVMMENYNNPEPQAAELVVKASIAAQRLDRQALLDANAFLAQAIKHGSRQPAVFAWSAYIQTLLLGQGWSSEREVAQGRLGELVDKAISLSADSASVLSIAGHVLSFSQRRLEEGLRLQETALAKNPSLPSAWLFSGLAHTYAGEHKEAISRLEHAKLLSPADDKAFFIEGGLSLSRLLIGDPKSAAQAAENAIRLNPNFSSSFKMQLAASGYLHPDERRQSHLRHLLFLEPGLTVERFLSRAPVTRRQDQQLLAEGLRLAGLPSA